MRFDEYQIEAHKTSSPDRDPIQHAFHGLAAESGEVAGVMQKYFRGDYDWDVMVEKTKKELGDILWYLAEVSTQLGLDLATVAEMNIRKLRSRQERNAIKGAGDDR